MKDNDRCMTCASKMLFSGLFLEILSTHRFPESEGEAFHIKTRALPFSTKENQHSSLTKVIKLTVKN